MQEVQISLPPSLICMEVYSVTRSMQISKGGQGDLNLNPLPEPCTPSSSHPFCCGSHLSIAKYYVMNMRNCFSYFVRFLPPWKSRVPPLFSHFLYTSHPLYSQVPIRHKYTYMYNRCGKFENLTFSVLALHWARNKALFCSFNRILPEM